MEPEAQVAQNQSTQSSRSNPNKLFLLAVPVIVISLAVIGYSLFRSFGGTKTDLAEERFTEISPWEHSDDEVAEPKSPSTAELDSIYKNIRRSIDTRDYELFKKYASAERIWNTENPKKLVNETAEGLPIFEKLSFDPIENFAKYAPYSVSYNQPKMSDITPTLSGKKPPLVRRSFIMIDPSSGEEFKANATKWRYVFELNYLINSGLPDTGTGAVTFVWDKDAWKYLGENWTISAHTTPIKMGDVTSEVAESVTLAQGGDCVPKEAEVPLGKAVAWENIYGRIFSVSPSEDFWDAGFLYNDSFFKVFNKAGSYTYIIVAPPNEPIDSKLCTIKVI